MTDHDRLATRREIADALTSAFERRHEVLDLIVEADDRKSAIDAIATLLGTSHLGGEAVMGMSFDKLTKDERRKNAAELEDLNSQLTFTLMERPASSGDTLELRPFSGSSDADIFAVRTEEVGQVGDGSARPQACWKMSCKQHWRGSTTRRPPGSSQWKVPARSASSSASWSTAR